MFSGMSLGRHSASISRVMKSTNPPSVLTPTGSPWSNTGTFTRMALSMEIWIRSAWMSSSVLESIWTSLNIASWTLESKATLKIVFSPVSDFKIRMTSFFARTRGTVTVPSPYRTAGIRPCFLSLRETFLPKASLCSALTVKLIISSLDKQGAHRAPLVDPADRLAEELGHRQDDDLPAGLSGGVERDSVGDEHLFDGRFFDLLDGQAGENGMGAGGQNPPGALFLQGLGAQGEGPRRVHHVVEDDNIAALDIADDVEDLGDVGGRPPLVDDGQARLHTPGEDPGSTDASRVRRDDTQLIQLEAAYVTRQGRHGR